VAAEEVGEPAQRLVDAHPHGILTGAEQGADFPVAAALEIAEQQRLAIQLAQLQQTFVQFARQGFEQGILVLHNRAEFEGGLFASLAAQFAAPPAPDLEQRRLVQPASQAGFSAQPCGFVRQGDEHVLRNLLCRPGIVQAAQRGSKHQVQMPLHQRLEGAFRPACRIVPQQIPVCLKLGHLSLILPPPGKNEILFIRTRAFAVA